MQDTDVNVAAICRKVVHILISIARSSSPVEDDPTFLLYTSVCTSSWLSSIQSRRNEHPCRISFRKMVSTYDLRTHYCFSNKLLSVFLGLFLLPVSRAVHAKNRRYSFPEYREYLAKLNFTPDLASNSTGKIIIPVTVPFVEGLTEVSFSKYKICSDECDSLLVNVTDTCDGCLVKHQRGSYTHMARWQLSADVLIALAYFSIPVELLFFLYKMRVKPEL